MVLGDEVLIYPKNSTGLFPACTTRNACCNVAKTYFFHLFLRPMRQTYVPVERTKQKNQTLSFRPCKSTTCRLPAFWCRPSTFWKNSYNSSIKHFRAPQHTAESTKHKARQRERCVDGCKGQKPKQLVVCTYEYAQRAGLAI